MPGGGGGRRIGNDVLDAGADGAFAWGGAGADRFYNTPPARGFYFTNFVAPFTIRLQELPGVQDFGTGDWRDAASR